MITISNANPFLQYAMSFFFLTCSAVLVVSLVVFIIYLVANSKETNE